MTSPLIKEMKISTKMNELIEPVFRALVNKKGGNKKVWTKVCTLATTIVSYHDFERIYKSLSIQPINTYFVLHRIEIFH